MKYALLTALLMSASAFACPNLTGTWTCSDDQGHKDVTTMTQEDIPNGVLYHAKNEDGSAQDFYTDGVTRNFDENGTTGTAVGTCTGANTISASVTFENKAYNFSGKSDMVLELTDANTFVMKATSVTSQAGGAPQTQTTVTTCKK